MAMMDDVGFLVSHLRNSFITSDETGMCEMILDDRKDKLAVEANTRRESSDSGLDTDTELPNSLDISPDMDLGGHRRRSNTAQRLDKLKRDRHNQSMIKHVKWKKVNHPASSYAELFSRKEVLTPQDRKTSNLSMLLEQQAEVTRRPFADYLRFDGKDTIGVQTIKLEICLPFVDERKPSNICPTISVIVISSARVRDLVGLVCFKYTAQGFQPPLDLDVQKYRLQGTSGISELDSDFPVMSMSYPVTKYHFRVLNFVLYDRDKHGANDSITVTIHIPGQGFTTLVEDNDEVLLKDVLRKVTARRRLVTGLGLDYTLEKTKEPGIAVNLDNPLSSFTEHDFCLVRANSARGPMEDDAEASRPPSPASANIMQSLSSQQYKSYRVAWLHGLWHWGPQQVQLGISGRKLEIDPVPSKSALFGRPKAAHYTMEAVTSCVLLEPKATGDGKLLNWQRSFRKRRPSHQSGKLSLRVVCMDDDSEPKPYVFECEQEMAKEIVSRINSVLESRPTRPRPIPVPVAKPSGKLRRRHTLHM